MLVQASAGDLMPVVQALLVRALLTCPGLSVKPTYPNWPATDKFRFDLKLSIAYCDADIADVILRIKAARALRAIKSVTVDFMHATRIMVEPDFVKAMVQPFVEAASDGDFPIPITVLCESASLMWKVWLARAVDELVYLGPEALRIPYHIEHPTEPWPGHPIEDWPDSSYWSIPSYSDPPYDPDAPRNDDFAESTPPIEFSDENVI